MPFVQRFSTTANGAVTFTGNTLGLSNNNTIYSDIGTFITLDLSKQVTGYPVGTTTNWKENASAALLTIPAGSEVLYAELIWGGSTKTSKEDVSAEIDTSIAFSTPSEEVLVSPDPSTSQQVTQASQVFYVRSANVTTLVKNGGVGQYQVSGVPATVQQYKGNNVAGWTLSVVYQDKTLPLRNMNLYVGTASIERSGAIDQRISGFSTPELGDVKARLLVTAMEGDSKIAGDQLLFGKDISSLQPVFGPNNAIDNFFASQINDDSGNLNPSGTDGGLNVTPGGATGGVRYNWDITNVDVSSNMENSQTQAQIRLTSKSDGYVVSGLGVQIDVNSPEIQVHKEVDKAADIVGETLTYTLLIENSGLTEANNVQLRDFLPPELTFVPGSLQIDGVFVSADPTTGLVNVGSVSIEGPIEVVFQAKILKVPPGNQAINKAEVYYEFNSAPGLPTATGSADSNEVTTVIRKVEVAFTKKEDIPVYNKAGNVILYTIEINNTGDTVLTDVMVKDQIPNGTNLVPGSIKRDGVPLSGNIESGINIGSVDPISTVLVTFEVQIDDPVPDLVANQAEIEYEYQLIPNGQVFHKEESTNEVIATLVENCKEAQKQIVAKVGTEELTAAGAIVAEKIKIQDAIRFFLAGNPEVLLEVNQQLNQQLRRIITTERQQRNTLEKAKKFCC